MHPPRGRVLLCWMAALPAWMGFEEQQMFGSRYCSLSAYLAVGHSWFPWNPFAFPWSHGSPASGGLHLRVLQAPLEHPLHPSPESLWAEVWISAAWVQHPGLPSSHPYPCMDSPALADPLEHVLMIYGLCHPQPAPHQDVCVHSRLLGKHEVATWCSACLAVCVWMKSYFSAISLAVLPPNYPISEGFYNINLYTKLQCWCGGVPLYLGVCVRGSKQGLDSWAALALQGDSGGVNRSMVTQDGPTSTVKPSLEQTDIIWNSWGCRGPLGLVPACKKPAEKPTLQMHLCRRVYRTSRSIKLLRLVFKKALTCVL